MRLVCLADPRTSNCIWPPWPYNLLVSSFFISPSSSFLIPPPPFFHSFYPPSNPFSQTLSKSCSPPISVTCLEPRKKDLSLIKTHVKFSRQNKKKRHACKNYDITFFASKNKLFSEFRIYCVSLFSNQDHPFSRVKG